MKTELSKDGNLKILMGFSGGLDSVVGAYLLKKQGHEVIGIGLSFQSEELEHISKLYDENGEEKPNAPFEGVYQIEDLDKLKKIADSLGIQFYAVQAATQYQYYVTDRIVASRIVGRSFAPKAATSRLILETLKAKAKQLNAEKIATGHYSKIVHNISLKTHHVFVSNDLEHDQSYLLSTVDTSTLSELVLPLSDMRKAEVEKIAKSLNLSYLPSQRTDPHVPIMKKPGIANFIEQRAPSKMFKEGSIIDYKNDSMMGEHLGIHHFGLGEKAIRIKSGVAIDKAYEVIGFKYTAGTVYVGLEDDLSYDTILMTQLKVPPGTDLSQPMEVFFKTKERGEKIEGTFFPHNNRFGEITLKKPQKGLVHQGEFIAMYNREGPMGRIVASGEVRISGLIDNGKLRVFPLKKDEIDEKESEKIVDIYRFRF